MLGLYSDDFTTVCVTVTTPVLRRGPSIGALRPVQIIKGVDHCISYVSIFQNTKVGAKLPKALSSPKLELTPGVSSSQLLLVLVLYEQLRVRYAYEYVGTRTLPLGLNLGEVQQKKGKHTSICKQSKQYIYLNNQ